MIFNGQGFRASKKAIKQTGDKGKKPLKHTYVTSVNNFNGISCRRGEEDMDFPLESIKGMHPGNDC